MGGVGSGRQPGDSARFCKRGHDKSIVGTYGVSCRACMLITGEANRQRRLELKAGRPRPAVCDICGEAPRPGERRLSFDHSHATGKFRGWLCGRCNTALGLARDSVEILLKLALYLERR